jgi:hypothetical protein
LRLSACRIASSRGENRINSSVLIQTPQYRHFEAEFQPGRKLTLGPDTLALPIGGNCGGAEVFGPPRRHLERHAGGHPRVPRDANRSGSRKGPAPGPSRVGTASRSATQRSVARHLPTARAVGNAERSGS